MDTNELLNENKKLKQENKELKKIIKEQEARKENVRLKEENYELKNIIKEKEYDVFEDMIDSADNEDARIISLLNRSSKRIKVLGSLEKENKIPTQISKDINDSSYNISKYLKVLKEYGLVICLNENDKRYRYYSITNKGKKYLNIIRDENR